MGAELPCLLAVRRLLVGARERLSRGVISTQKHYLEDSGKHDEAAKVTEGRTLYHCLASGVAIQKAGS